MSDSQLKSIWLQLRLNPDDPQLLETLEQMLRSGMLDAEQIKQIASVCLSERLPIASSISEMIAYAEPEPILASPVVEPEPAAPTIWQTLKDELSVRWLLFLGVFLVVLSSGVLAATQWSRFPAWGQYGLLWLYTIGFWLAGSWTKRQEGLKLTANTLQIAALLLIPVNFWAIDSFGLWHQPWEIAIALVATSSLVGIAYLQTLPRRSKSRSDQWLMGALIGLSCLQLGWQIPHWAAISIYIGSIGIAIILQKTHQIEKGALAIFGLGMLILRGFFVVHLPVTSFSLAIGIVGWLFAQWGIQYQQKLQRVESIALKHPSPQINKHQKTLSGLITLYHRLGAGLLALGWLLGLGELQTSPWQSVAVSGLALIWIWQRLQRDQRNPDLVWLFVVGLQAYFLSNFLWRFISTGALLAMVLPWIKQFFGENYLFAGGLLVFPYLLFWVWLTGWFWRKDQQSLARTGEGLMMGTGLLMAFSTGASPLGLLIDLVASTAIMAYLTDRHRPIRTSYLYLTHLGGLLTVFAAVNYRWDWCRLIGQSFIAVTDSSMSNTLEILVVGSLVSMVLAAIELFFSTRKATLEQDDWQRSAWDYGQILAGLSYGGFLLTLAAAHFMWPLWLMIIPAAFTYVAIYPLKESAIPVWQQNASKQANWWAIGSMAGSILLTGNDTNWRSILLAISIMMICPIMWKMAQEPLDLAASEQSDEDQGFQQRRLSITQEALAVAMIHIGFGLGLGANLLQNRIANPQWLIIAAVVSSGLWFVSKRLQSQKISPSAIYAKAGDAWASILAAIVIVIGIASYFYTNLQFLPITLGSKSFQTIGSPFWFNSLDFSLLLATTMLLWAMANRQQWRSAWTPAVWFTTALITGQIILGSGIYLLGGNTWTLAIGNVFLAFCLYCWQTFGQPRFSSQSATAASLMPVLNSSALPSLLAAWGLLLRLPFFNSYSGLLSIGIGAVLVLSSRSHSFKLPAYGGLLLVTLGCYELVTYQILQAPAGGNIADALTIYGLVTAILALIYRSTVWLKSRQGAAEFWDLRLDSLKNVAHAHWAIASTWKIAAAVTPPIPLPHFTILHLITSGLLGIYALIQGRDRKDNGDWWVYLGLAELMGVGVYARSIFQGLGIVDSNLILLTCLIGLMLMLAPWSNWGWRDRPWRIVALVLPLSRVIFEWDYISLLNLVILATFYAGVARRQRQFGWAYLSLVFVNWAGMRLLWQYSLTSPIWYAVMIGLSTLAAVQWDPAWQKSRQNRHYGRLAGVGIIAVTALIWHVSSQPWLPIGLGLTIGAAGLVWRVRAWLYVGTITFLLSNFYQLVILITERPVTKWAIGLFAGMLIIFLAANFEKRREQITLALQHWLDQLQEWQ